MAPVDLYAAEDKARHYFHAAWVQPTVLALVAELRAAREVVETARALQEEISGEWAEVNDARAALAAYDGAVASPPSLTTPARRP